MVHIYENITHLIRFASVNSQIGHIRNVHELTDDTGCHTTHSQTIFYMYAFQAFVSVPFVNETPKYVVFKQWKCHRNFMSRWRMGHQSRPEHLKTTTTQQAANNEKRRYNTSNDIFYTYVGFCWFLWEYYFLSSFSWRTETKTK